MGNKDRCGIAAPQSQPAVAYNNIDTVFTDYLFQADMFQYGMIDKKGQME